VVTVDHRDIEHLEAENAPMYVPYWAGFAGGIG